MKLSAPFRTRMVLMFASLAILIGCSDDDPAPTQPTVTTGVFLDAAVQGLSYTSGAKSGLTDATGKFEYEAGQTVAFDVGNIDIGSPAPAGAAVLTPIQLVLGAVDQTNPTVTNISRFLLTIDDDANPANGILITDAVQQEAAGASSLNFTQSITEFESDPEVLETVDSLTSKTGAGTRTLVSASEAQAHLAATLSAAREGSYSGILDEAHTGGVVGVISSSTPAGVQHQLGTWTFSVNGEGVLTGSATMGSTNYPMSATLGSNGFFEGLGEGKLYHFEGTIAVDGSVTGEWHGPNKIHGHIEGDKN